MHGHGSLIKMHAKVRYITALVRPVEKKYGTLAKIVLARFWKLHHEPFQCPVQRIMVASLRSWESLETRGSFDNTHRKLDASNPWQDFAQNVATIPSATLLANILFPVDVLLYESMRIFRNKI